MGKVDNLGELPHMLVCPNAEIVDADSPFGVDRRAFGEDQRRAAEGELAEVHEVPWRCVAIVGCVLTHWGNHDAVLKSEATNVQGREQQRPADILPSARFRGFHRDRAHADISNACCFEFQMATPACLSRRRNDISHF